MRKRTRTNSVAALGLFALVGLVAALAIAWPNLARAHTGDASLTALMVTAGETAQTLTPAFSSTVTDYTVAVANNVTQITIEATPDGDGSVTYQNTDGTTLTDADTSVDGQQVDLPAAGGKRIDVVVTHGTDTQTYTVLVSHEGTFDSEDPCAGGGYNPTPTAVAVDAVPIVVESTTADYFVLYVRNLVDPAWEAPVSVTRGEAGTTSLTENVEALPKERYRVEKYLVADPADVDGDCTDDITELDNLGSMNPVNAAAGIALTDGAVAIPDEETFTALSEVFASRSGGWTHVVKFFLGDTDTDRPLVYFMNTSKHLIHQSFIDAVGPELGRHTKGKLTYHPELVAPDGSQGLYYFSPSNLILPAFSHAERSYTQLAASMRLLDDNLAVYIPNRWLSRVQSDLQFFRASRMHLVFDEDLFSETDFQALNPGEGYGRLRALEPDERPHPREIVLYEALPNELPRVAGIISTVPQTPLSHVNLRAVQDGVPNAFIRGALDEDEIDDLIGSYVRYTVTETGWDIRAATRAQVDAHYTSSRPTGEQTPQRDLSVTTITPLGEIGFDDWDAFGVKAANVAVLGTLDFPEGTVPDGFAIPFYFYDEFMKHNGFYARIETMLADSDFQTDFDTQESELKKLRKDIEDAETPAWIIAAIVEMNKSFADGVNRRYRSSTNNEDLPGFNGAGLYDSKSQKPSEDEKDLAKSLKEVYASLWNFRAFVERDFHRIDHTAAAMGILVHPSYKDEEVNGVAVSFDPVYDQDDAYYVNSQVGEDLVTNPDALSVPEEVLLHKARRYTILSTSNQASPGSLLMSDDQLNQLRRHLAVIHAKFTALYNPSPDEPFAMEIEFKITSDNILAIKQARPWVFGTASSTPSPPTITTTSSSATGLRQPENRTSRLYTYRATDPEGGTITWSVGGIDGQAFTIDEQGQFSFKETSPPNFEIPGDSGRDNIYDVTVQARDDQSNTATLPVTVTVTDVNEAPEIHLGDSTHNYDENGIIPVDQYIARDPDGPTSFSWSLSGTDRGDFNINSNGQLQFASPPDYERPADSGGNNHYEVIVEATDSNNTQAELHVDVIVQNVDEPPVLDGPDTVDDFPENSASSRQVARYTASDPEGATATISLTAGGADFSLASDGVLTLKASPDFEEQSRYSATVGAVAGSHAVNKTVTINIQNVEEPGTASLSTVQPQEGTQLSVELEDDDIPYSTRWQWYRTSSRGSTGTAITSATSRFYTPDASDVGSYLRAVASYDDGHGTGKTATAVSANRVQEAPPTPESPVFPVDGNYDRSIRENTRAGANLGAPVRATDANNDRLTYSIPASDYFEIDASSGQLRTKAMLDHETGASHTVIVTATDPGNLTDTMTVTITVEDADETPVVSGPASPEVAENGNPSVATYTATDPDNKGIKWVLTGSDSDDFTLSGGALTFNEVPDYEEGNRYRVTIEAREQGDGASVGRLSVTIRVTNVDEPGVLETNVEEPRVGQSLRLNVEDGDGGVNVREWKWERGVPNSPCGTVDNPTVTTWEAISRATSNSYTTTLADQGQCIRATAFYNDRAGTGRTEQFLTTNSVEIGPYFTQGPQTYRVEENTAEGRDIGRVQARHSNSGEAMTYRMNGADARYFTIDNNAQLKISVTPLDYETQPGEEAVVEITAEDNNGQIATITVTVTVTDECTSAGEPPCAPGRPSVRSASDTSLRVTWSSSQDSLRHIHHRL